MRQHAPLLRMTAMIVAIAYFGTFVAGPSYAQPTSVQDPPDSQSLDCDLTGLWRSSRGPMRIVATPYETPAQPITQGVNATGALSTDTTAVITGTLEAADGEISFDGFVRDDVLDLRWFNHSGENVVIGYGLLDIDETCNALDGAFSVGEGRPIDQAWVGRRIDVSSQYDSSADPAGYQASLLRLEEGFDAIAELRASLPQVVINVAARSRQLGPSVEDIFAFVRDEISFEVYSGVLRGARGTLAAAAGNAADQSLLLAEMLQHQGYETRFAFGELDPETTDLLIDSVGPRDRPVEEASVDPVLRERLLTVSGTSSDDLDALEEFALSTRQQMFSFIDESVQSSSAFIEQHLSAQLFDLDLTVIRADQIQQTIHHVWVQVERDGSWIDLDPLSSGPAGTALATADAFENDVPASLYHLVQFQVGIERYAEGMLEETELAGWQIRTADLADRGFPGIWISNLPLDDMDAFVGGGSLSDFVPSLEQQSVGRLTASNQFQPMLVLSTGETQMGAAFDINGNVIPDDWRIAAVASVSRSTETAITTATSVLEGLFDEPAPPNQTPVPTPMLSAQWLDISVVGPSMERESERRYLVDRIGPAARESGEYPPVDQSDDALVDLRLSLGAINEVMVTTDGFHPALAFDTMLAVFEGNQDWLESVSAVISGIEPFDAGLMDGIRFYPNKLMSFRLLEQDVVQTIADRAGLHAYGNAAFVTLRRLGLRTTEDGSFEAHQLIDLVHSSYAIGLGSDPTSETYSNLQRAIGVGRTALEQEALYWFARAECLTCEVERPVGALSLLAELERQGVGFSLFTPGTATALPAGLTGDQMQMIEAELTAGFWVIVPERSLLNDGEEILAWWRINPRTGAVLGMVPVGGGAIAEYMEAVAGMVLLFWPTMLGVFFWGAGCIDYETDELGIGCTFCVLFAAICLQIAWFAWPPLGVLAAGTSCGVAGGTLTFATCGITRAASNLGE
ncbi:MAG: transglutaminase domain-containing protein [Azospirillaceae bacterium]